VRRVLAVLDPIGGYGAVLDVALDLGRRLQAAGTGLLLRDEALLGTADLSLVQEVRRVPAAVSAHTREGAEHQFRTRVRHIEQRLLESAAGTMAWTVAVDSGMTRAPVVRVVREGDLVVVGQDERGGTAYERLGEALLAEGPHPVLMVPPAAQPVRSVQVVYDDTPAAQRALVLAGGLARRVGAASVGVIGVGEASPDWAETIGHLLAEQGVSAVVIPQARLDIPAAIRTLNAKRGLLVLPAATFRREGPSLAYALRLLRWPFLLLP
jgi:hypothetical protein